MVNVSETTTPYRDDKMSADGHPCVFNERPENPHARGQSAAGPQKTLYTGPAK